MEEKEEEEEEVRIKVTCIGSEGVGKSSIIKSYIKGSFDLDNASTCGADYYKKELKINNRKILLDIWDTAGQEKFHSVGRQFYRNSYIIIMVYDMTNIKSFEEIKNYWINDVLEHGEKYKIIALVGNKIDLYDAKGMDEIDEKIIKQFLDNISKNNKDCIFINERVSAKKNENIKSLFDKLIQEYFGKEFNQKINGKILEDGQSFKIQKKKKTKKKCC